MKLYTTKPMNILKYSLIIFSAIILIGITGLFTFGFNYSYQLKNYYEISAIYFEESEYDSKVASIKEQLSSYEITDSYFETSSNGFYNILNVKFTKKNFDKVDELKEKIYLSIYVDDTYPINDSYVTISKVTSTTANSFKWIALATVISMCAIIFVLAFIFVKTKGATVVMLSYIFSLLTSLSIVLFTRLPLTIASASSVFVVSIFTSIISLLLILYVREKMKESKENSSSYLIMSNFIVENFKKILISVCTLILIFILLMFTFDINLITISSQIIISLIVSVLDLIFISIPIYAHFMGETKK